MKSREMGFFYGHPQNRFWKVLAALLDVSVHVTIEEKRTMLLEHHIAVWDVIASCTITGSSDSSIKDVVPNDLGRVLKEAPIEKIYANGATAWKLYNKYTKKMTGMEENNYRRLMYKRKRGLSWNYSDDPLLKYFRIIFRNVP